MGKLGEEEKKKKEIEELGEKIDWLGQDSEVKGANAIKEVQREEDKRKEKKEWDNLEILYGSRYKAEIYRSRLMAIARARASDYKDDLPQGFLWSFELTSRGLVMWIKMKGKLFARGMQISGLPTYDLNGVDRLIYRALDFMDNESKPKNGSFILN